jgi:hypothetical protein
MPVIALYDACVLYPAPLRDFLMWLGLTGSVRARWTAQIHEEWKRSLLRKRPDLTSGQLDRTSALMDRAIPEALVSGYEAIIPSVNLPDPDDRHVLAAAIHGGASIVVTFNTKDFPGETLASFGIAAQPPDEFVKKLFDHHPAAVIEAARRQRRSLNNPPVDASTLLQILRKQGLEQTADLLSCYSSQIG